MALLTPNSTLVRALIAYFIVALVRVENAFDTPFSRS